MFGADPLLPLAAFAALVSVAGVGWVFVGGSPSSAVVKKRVKAVSGRATSRGRRSGSTLDPAAQRRKQVQDTLKEIEDKQKKARKKNLSLKARIEQAGLTITLRTFWMVSAGTGALAAVFALVAGKGPLIALAATVTMGLGMPRWVIGFMRSRRMKKFSGEFANAIDIIVRGVKSGLPLGECLKIIANEAPDPIGEEFRELVEGMGLGVSIDDGLRRMFERMPLSELNFFGVVLAIQQKTGGNLAEALGNLSMVLRSRKMMREKISALSSEAKSSAGIIGSLPPGVFFLVYFTAPEYMGLMFTETLGRLMLLGGIGWMAIGVFVMKNMISFKI